ncbi:hypothetical protein FDA94_01290 [Herbidospora galbida]|uniref:DMATS type aromatic prenyltransferase n=1 Tax=Herbidospora galbida TaxID=2575442 RepID=A0A4U3MP58_9ACTN|nr:tryptophan dimethylallyltransferase family protein [Herbidospora galbida]TKK91448.1 hypothetical protein FDA94_01290 [Herbidospora galbida]
MTTRLHRGSDSTELTRTGGRTYAGIGRYMLSAFGTALGYSTAGIDRMSRDFSSMLAGWGELPVGTRPRYLSGVANDHMPIEFSLAWTPDTAHVRALVEPLGAHPTPRSVQAEAARLVRALAIRQGVSIGRYLAIEDVFLDREPVSPFSLWHSVVWGDRTTPMHKVYFNPRVKGDGAAPELVRRAMTRLGRRKSWRVLETAFGGFADLRDHPVFFSLDLVGSPDSRVKVYFRHEGMTAAQIDRVGPLMSYGERGLLAEVCGRVLGHAGPYRKAPITCVTFRGEDGVVDEVTLHLPLSPNLPNDAVAADRVSELMRHAGIDDAGYRAALAAGITRPLERSTAQSWAGFKNAHQPTVTVYIGPEVYRP